MGVMLVSIAKKKGCPFGGKCAGHHCMAWAESYVVLSEEEYEKEAALFRQAFPKASEEDVDEHMINLGLCSIVESMVKAVGAK